MSSVSASTAILPGSTDCNRSAESLRFQALRDEACGTQLFLHSMELFSEPFSDLLPFIGIVEPARDRVALQIKYAGQSVIGESGQDLPGNDYLSIVQEGLRAPFHRLAMEMISRPCGLWGRVSTVLNNNVPFDLELTGVPLRDEAGQQASLAFLVRHAPAPVGTKPAHYVSEVTGGLNGVWIDLGAGVHETPPVGFL